jgi:hypothetical protein
MRLTRALASFALALSLLALVLAGYALHAQRRAEESFRRIGRELSRSLGPSAPLRHPPPALELDDT